MKRRLSLRSLLLLTAAVAALDYWRDRPRQTSNRFVTAFRAKDKAAVDSLLVGEAEGNAIFPFAESDAEFTAVAQPQTLAQWLKGERNIDFSIEGTWSLKGSAIATARGISRWGGTAKVTPRVSPSSGYSLQVQGMPPRDLPASGWEGLLQPGQPSTLSNSQLNDTPAIK